MGLYSDRFLIAMDNTRVILASVTGRGSWAFLKMGNFSSKKSH